MAKVLTSEGRIIHVVEEKTVFTALKEADGEDPFLSEKRKQGFSVVKIPKSYLSVVAQESSIEKHNKEYDVKTEEQLLATQIL